MLKLEGENHSPHGIMPLVEPTDNTTSDSGVMIEMKETTKENQTPVSRNSTSSQNIIPRLYEEARQSIDIVQEGRRAEEAGIKIGKGKQKIIKRAQKKTVNIQEHVLTIGAAYVKYITIIIVVINSFRITKLIKLIYVIFF